MPNPITGVNKFRYVLVLQGYYGRWEDVCEYADKQRDYADARDDLRAHRANEPYPFRLITRRELEPEYSFTPADYLLRARNLRSMANIAKQNARNYAGKLERYEWLADLRSRAENQARLVSVLRNRAQDACRKGKLLRDAAGR